MLAKVHWTVNKQVCPNVDLLRRLYLLMKHWKHCFINWFIQSLHNINPFLMIKNHHWFETVLFYTGLECVISCVLIRIHAYVEY